MLSRETSASSTDRFSPLTKPENEGYTLTQLTEIIRGQADAILKRAIELQRQLGRGPLEKDPGHPERAHSGPHDILLNARDDMHRAEVIVSELIAYVGEPGNGAATAAPPRGER